MNRDMVKLHAVIGVWIKDDRAFYVKRSSKMKNYPSVWSLFSIQHAPDELTDPSDLESAQPLMERMASERLYGAPVRVTEHLCRDDSDTNPIDTHVFLNLYAVSFAEEPKLHTDYYSAGAWMTFDEFEETTRDMTCGSCTRMWWDTAWLKRMVNRPYPGTGAMK